MIGNDALHQSAGLCPRMIEVAIDRFYFAAGKKAV
jgi:hypothetical protein